MDELLQLIRTWTARARLQSSLRWLFMCLTGGLGAALAISIIAHLFPILSAEAINVAVIACVTISIAIAVLLPLARTVRRTPADWAREFDQRFHLKERLSTALELREGVRSTHNEHMIQRQQADASDAARRVDVRTMLPLRISGRYLLYSIIIGAALAISLTLPNPQLEVLANRTRAQQAIAAQVQQIEDIKQQVAQSPTLSEQQKRDITRSLEDVQQTLQDPNSTPEQALAAINEAQAKLDALRDQASQAQRDDLQRAGQAMAPDQRTNPLANALEKGDFRQAAEQMRNLTQPNGQPLTEQQRQQLADQLEQLARNLQNSSPQTAKQLRDAAQNIRQGQMQAAQQALNNAADALNRAAEQSAANQQVEAIQQRLLEARRAVDENQQPSTAALAQLDQNPSAPPERDAVMQQGTGAADQSGQPGQASDNASLAGDPQDSSGGGGSTGQRTDAGTDDSIYAPERITAGGEEVAVQGEEGENAANPSGSPSQGITSGSTVPYQSVFPQYARTADEAIRSGSVPAGLRDYVRDYFSSLDPRQQP